LGATERAKLQQQVTLRIPEAGISKVFQTDSRGRAEISFDAKWPLWSPENPKLYKVEIASETERVQRASGFVRLKRRARIFCSTEHRFFLRGINIHEESPVRPAAPWNEDDARTLLIWAKDLGCNFVRLAHTRTTRPCCAWRTRWE